jgi:TolB-like protein
MVAFSKGSDDAIEKSIAVLPFEVISKDSNQEYLGDGFADAIITRFIKILQKMNFPE